MECHALSSGIGFAYEIFRFLLHSPEAIQARTEENPKNVFAPDRKQPPFSTFPTPEKRSHPHMASRGNILKRLSSLWTSFPLRKNNTPEIKKPGAASRRAGPAK